jgi:hypothetical protein
MASIISAGTTSGTALNMAGDTSGVLELATNGSTTAITIDTSQRAAFVAGTAALPAITTTGDTDTGIFFPAADTIAFAEGGVEAARFDSSGNLLVGTTSTASYGAGIGRLYLSASGANWQVGPTSAFANFYVKAGSGFGVGMTTTATSWSSDSDERKKTTIIPFTNAAEKVCSLRAGTGRYLTDEESMSRSFLIAQDVQAVLPEAVDVGEDEQQSLMLRYTDLIPLLTAAIQEQQTIINDLTARVTALEGA